jgi:catechol 2,3-dioxygenase-like lactoylglutathione lyase family enzyme
MRLNHIDIPVRDVAANVAFLERYFELRRQSHKASPALTILSDGQGFVLVLQRREAPAEAYPDGFHIGFLLDSPDSVRALWQRARSDGAEVSDVIENGRGTIIYFTAPDGYRVEVSHQRVRFQ